jgi:DNA-binding response OmpR family regulator
LERLQHFKDASVPMAAGQTRTTAATGGAKAPTPAGYRPSERLDFSRIRALVGDHSPMIRTFVRNGLQSMGVRQITETSTMLDFHGAANGGGHDLIVVNSELENSDACALVRDIRAGQLGGDPFVVVMLVLTNGDEEHVRWAVDSGADDMLLVPFAPNQLMSKVGKLAERRKPFVVTHDYIGPDRRSAERMNERSAERFSVPNPVAARAANAPEARYAARLTATRRDMELERLRRLATHLPWGTGELFQSLREGRADPTEVFRQAHRLSVIAGELAARAGDTTPAPTREALDHFMRRLNTLRDTPEDLSEAHVTALDELGRRIRDAFTD